MTERLEQLPEGLPVPEDDGAARHLVGSKLVSTLLCATDGRQIDPAELRGSSVLYCYPRTGVPGEALPMGWNEIPGARGCTPEACGFRDHHAALHEAGVRVLGLSTQEPDVQREVVERLQLPFPLLSDSALRFSRGMRLPTFDIAGTTLLKRLTLILRDGLVEHCFYPVFPPDSHAAEVLAWIAAARASTGRRGR